jgi:tetratricopeptide (TPR) repeat protein
LIAYAAWLVLYVIAIPFSSSRTGWLGLAVWAGVLAVFWLFEAKSWKRLVVFGGVIIVLVVLLGSFAFVRYFSAPPSHDNLSSIFSGHGNLWNSALTIWRSSPWVGAGPGRFGMEFLGVNTTVPPQYWASNSHSLIFETLAEFGLVGVITGLALLMALVFFVYRRYRAANPDQRWPARAVVAALAAWLAQNVVEDFTFWIAIMVPLVLLLAWLGTAGREKLPRQNHLSAAWIGLLALVPATLVGWSIWTYAPMARGLQSASDGNWQAAAQQIQASAQRDPSLAFYQFEASLAWAQAWAQDGNDDELQQAIQDLQKMTVMEPEFSLAWEDMAIEESDAGQPFTASIDLRHAEELAHDEPSYQLNLGILYESLQRDELAIPQYQKVLELAPEWSSHPVFWNATLLRAGVLENWRLTTDYFKNHTPTDWQKAQVSSDKGMRRKLAADSQWLGESSFAGNAILGAAMLADADLFAQSYAEAAAAGIDLQSLHSTNRVALTYSLWINNRMGLPFDLVPGYAQLDVDAGQFYVLQQLYQMQVQQGKCTAAEQTWYKLQGSLFPGRVKLATPPDTCIAKVE